MAGQEVAQPTELALEAEQLTPYLRHLLFFICIATFFEAYDVIIINLALPYLGQEFQADSQTLGLAISIISIGTIAAFLPVRLADKYGRRPVLLLVVSGYTLFTVATIFCTNIYNFVVLQFIARMFMVAEVGIGSIMLTEEMPARYRGRTISLMVGAGLVGGTIAALVFPFLIKTPLGWRMLYLLGGILLPLLLLYWNRIQETRRWLDQHSREGKEKKSLSQEMRETLVIFQPQYRRSLFAGTSIWFLTNFWSSAALFFFTYYVMQERGWTPELVGKVLPVASLLGISGYVLSGPLLDFLGRRMTACLYFSLGGISAAICFQAETPWVIAVAYVFVVAMNAVWAIAATITSEIFPTAIRATGNAVVNNLLGRTGMVIAPALVGILSKALGSVGDAITILVLCNFLGIPVIVFLLSETKGRILEEIAS